MTRASAARARRLVVVLGLVALAGGGLILLSGCGGKTAGATQKGAAQTGPASGAWGGTSSRLPQTASQVATAGNVLLSYTPSVEQTASTGPGRSASS